ncbi:M23 family peptidase, partial [Enterococcus faecalis]
MKKILISVLGVLSIVVSMAFSSYSVNAASNDWSWPLGKPYAGRYEEGQQFGNTAFDRGGTYFHDGFDFGSAIYGNGSVYAVHDGKILYAGWDPVGGG